MTAGPRASELILNNDGSIYHLHLHPEDVADIIITVGDPERVPSVSRHFDSITVQQHKREFITHTGYIGNKRLTVISTGIGPDNMDIVLNELHALRQYDLITHEKNASVPPYTIIRFGTSGCIQPDIPPGTLLQSEFAIGLDNLMHFYKYMPKEAESTLLNALRDQCVFDENIIPYVCSADKPMMAHFASTFIPGITLTAPGFYAPQGREVNLPLKNPQMYSGLPKFTWQGKRITNFEMETTALYGLGSLLGHRCLSLNVLLANRATGEFHPAQQNAIDVLIEKGLELILQL